MPESTKEGEKLSLAWPFWEGGEAFPDIKYESQWNTGTVLGKSLMKQISDTAPNQVNSWLLFREAARIPTPYAVSPE